ncbi:hypothetical protein QR685DRAFT_568083 [Neurospora intermedia]|uniref:Uncharacterized protein n=1 Tax=Neurospora intermedia TaxID=5142 RepID=A0ABR3DRH4_NEUIN
MADGFAQFGSSRQPQSLESSHQQSHPAVTIISRTLSSGNRKRARLMTRSWRCRRLTVALAVSSSRSLDPRRYGRAGG